MRFLFVFLAVGMLAGCVTTPTRHWQHKTIPSEQWSSDQRRCQRAAERYLGLDTQYHADRGLSAYDERMRQFEVGKKMTKLVGDCMRKRGYVPVD